MVRPVVYPIPSSLEEAEFYRDSGVAPKRPRNTWEKKAKLASPRGRPASGRSKTRLAVELARHFVEADGMPKREAAKKAAAGYGLKAPDAVLKLLRKALAGPQVMIKPRTQGNPFGGLLKPRKVPLLVSVEDFKV